MHHSMGYSLFSHGAALCSHPECCVSFWLHRAAHSGTALFIPTPHLPHSTCFFPFPNEPAGTNHERGAKCYTAQSTSPLLFQIEKQGTEAKREVFTISAFIKKYVERNL